MTTERTQITADAYFSIIPEWILYADVSANAVRVYGVLRRHADKDGSCHPTRRRIADLARTSMATVDRALDELREIGAIDSIQRKSPKGDWTSNQYVVRSLPARGVSSPVTTPLITGDDTGLVTRDEQTIAIVNTEPRTSASKNDATNSEGSEAAKRWWEAQQVKPVGKRAWHALKAVCEAAAARGYNADQIIAALDRIGTVPSVAQMDRELKRPNAGWETTRERQLREAAHRLREETELEHAALSVFTPKELT